jgi:hypothetical protein
MDSELPSKPSFSSSSPSKYLITTLGIVLKEKKDVNVYIPEIFKQRLKKTYFIPL